MKNLNRILELKSLVNNADTSTVGGRQTVASSCKELYNLIEGDVFKADCEWMLTGMYNDLCNGNFAEPFMCEQKKSVFSTVSTIYNEKIIPSL